MSLQVDCPQQKADRNILFASLQRNENACDIDNVQKTLENIQPSPNLEQANVLIELKCGEIRPTDNSVGFSEKEFSKADVHHPVNTFEDLDYNTGRVGSPTGRRCISEETVLYQDDAVSSDLKQEKPVKVDENDPSSENHSLSEEGFDPDSQNGGTLPTSNGDSYLFGSSVCDKVPDSCRDKGPLSLETDSLVDDHAVALWIKWRGKWQSGIRCPRADCPLSNLNAKPTHERKKYFAVYFPRTRTYSWADMQLVCSIDEFPEPLLSGSHRRWKKLVKDLTLPRRYIMQKLAVVMLNLSDQLHTEAVTENARKATTWKEFALEASCCRTYSGLGHMLLKLKNMILPTYLNQNWRELSFNSWLHRCANAESAESIEMLTQELVDSVLWKEVEELWNVPQQPVLDSEWKTWKLEALKLFSIAHPRAGKGSLEQNGSNTCVGVEISTKRPKLEIRRAEYLVSQTQSSGCNSVLQGTSVGAGFEHPNCQSIVPYVPKHVVPITSAIPSCKFSEILSADGEKVNVAEISEEKCVDGASSKALAVYSGFTPDGTKRYVQCSAFVVAKGRQCGRWANDGDMFCCVHLNSRFAGPAYQSEPKPPDEAPMCAGTTTCGSKCKHRARYGSAFCKKHCLQASITFVNRENSLDFSGGRLKRKYDASEERLASSNAVSGEDTNPVLFQVPLQDNLAPISMEKTLDQRNHVISEFNISLPVINASVLDISRCIGNFGRSDWEQCLENPAKHTLYCEKHLPRFLKRARNGRSRLISKDVFIGLLRNSPSRKQKLFLHQACELLYQFMKSNLSRQKLISRDESLRWILAEASSDPNVGQYLLKLITNERDKIARICGFDTDKTNEVSSLQSSAANLSENVKNGFDAAVRCKVCLEQFLDDHALGLHWTENHKKDAQWMFRGYACAVCKDSFSSRKVLKIHVKESHGMQFLEHSTLFRCISCGSDFLTQDQLWVHVLSLHTADLRKPDPHVLYPGQETNDHFSGNPNLDKNVAWREDDSQRYICRFCGLKFDLLPDLGRHHQAAHGNQITVKRGNNPLRPNQNYYPRFKRIFGTSLQNTSQRDATLQKHFQSSSSSLSAESLLQNRATAQTSNLWMLVEPQCSDVAEALFSEIQKTKPRPNNLEILAVARTTCCRINLHAALEVKFGFLPENLYLRAAKLCSELNIPVEWHREGFSCPKGCKPLKHTSTLAPLKPLSDWFVEPSTVKVDTSDPAEWEMDECHYVLDSNHFNKLVRKPTVLCQDVSFGKEPVPVPCVVDEEFKDYQHLHSKYDAVSCQDVGSFMPWEAFNYAIERFIDPSLGLDTKNSQLGCTCPNLKCCPENCDHVYLFENDYEDAMDIYGQPMHGRFPYNERGQIILEQGYLVYECNAMCHCDRTCHNRVLQNGVQVKLEVFKTKEKGWGVRAGEAIPHGTFVCEYIGEVLSDAKANQRRERYDRERCSYLYDVDACIDSTRGLGEGASPYAIDATEYGNVSRFINHGCFPNLVSYLVLVESMDCQLAHVGLYASRDISLGEELVYDYRYKLRPDGEGQPCHCGAPNCRGRVR